MCDKGKRKKKREYDLGGIMSEMVRGKEVENGVMGRWGDGVMGDKREMEVAFV